MPDAETPRHRVLTPSGRAALAIVLVEGCARLPPMLRTPAGAPCAWPRDGCVVHARLVDDDRVIDDLVARGTAQGVELHVHGGEAVVLSVCATLEAAGSRPSTEPDTGDLPGSLRHARALASSRWGELARLAHEARLAVARGTISPALRGRLESVQARRMLARHLRSPPVVRLVGRPNAGKSTLFNALLSDDRALVSPREGTTRDTVSALLVLADAPVRLEDTAGVCGRQPDCAGADLVVHVLESDEPCPGEDATGVPTLHVRGKSDLRPTTDDVPRVLALSGRTRLGLDELLSRIAHALALDGDARDDVLAPVDPRLERLWDDALALPDEASEGA